MEGIFCQVNPHTFTCSSDEQKATADFVYILINSATSFDELRLGQLVCPLNVTELSNANSHSVSLLNVFRGVCIYRRGSANKSHRIWRLYFQRRVLPLTIVSMKTDIGRTIYTCYLIAGEKNRRVKSAGTLKNHARESLTLSDIHQNLMFRVLCINAGSDTKRLQRERENVVRVHCTRIKTYLTTSYSFRLPRVTSVRLLSAL